MAADVVDVSQFDRYRKRRQRAEGVTAMVKSAGFIAIGFALALVVDNFTGVSKIARGYIGG